jgi:hypothetical protein
MDETSTERDLSLPDGFFPYEFLFVGNLSSPQCII